MIKKYKKNIASVDDFFVDTLRFLHDKAKVYGYAVNGMVYVKELIPYGQTYLLQLLNDNGFREKFGQDAISYYFNVACYTFSSGVFYADCWQKDSRTLSGDDKIQYLALNNPCDLAEDILNVDSQKLLDEFLSKIFDDWLENMAPYWNVINNRDYIFQGLLAFYYLGISERLRSLGLKS